MTAKSPRKKGAQRRVATPQSPAMRWLSYVGVALLAALIVILIGVGRQYLANKASSDATITLPNFVGESLAQAQSQAPKDHVTVHIFYIASDQVKNTILDQNPEAGIKAPINAIVNLAVSTGPGNAVPTATPTQ